MAVPVLNAILDPNNPLLPFPTKDILLISPWIGLFPRQQASTIRKIRKAVIAKRIHALKIFLKHRRLHWRPGFWKDDIDLDHASFMVNVRSPKSGRGEETSGNSPMNCKFVNIPPVFYIPQRNQDVSLIARPIFIDRHAGSAFVVL